MLRNLAAFDNVCQSVDAGCQERRWASEIDAYNLRPAPRTATAAPKERAMHGSELPRFAVPPISERDRIWDVSQDLLIVADPNGKLLSINPAWTATLGWSEGD